MRKIGLIILFLIFSFSTLLMATDSIKVAAIYALTGEASKFNKKSVDGIKLAVDEINNKGGVLRKKIKLNIYDNFSKNSGSMVAAEKAVSDGCVAILGCAYSSHSLAVAPVAQKNKIPMISNISTNPQVTRVGDYIFRVCFVDQFQGEIMAKFAKENLKAKNAVIFSMTGSGSKYSADLASFFKTSFIKFNGTIINQFFYSKNDQDYSRQLQRIKELQPEIVYLPGYSSEVGLIIKHARKLGVKSIFLGGDGWSGIRILKYTGPFAAGSYFTNHWHHGVKSKMNKLFLESYKNYFGEDISANSNAALAYDAVYLLVDAIKRAGNFKPADIRQNLALTKKFQGVTGKISFDDNGDPEKSVVIIKISENSADFYKVIDP